MWKGKRKLVVIGLLTVVLAGSIAGVAFAQSGATAASSNNTVLDRTAAILKIDPQTLKNAYAQAQKEMQDQRLTDYFNNLVKQGKMSQADADKYRQWWQSRPNVAVPGGNQPFGMHRFGGRGMMRGGPFFGGKPPAPAPAPAQPQ